MRSGRRIIRVCVAIRDERTDKTQALLQQKCGQHKSGPKDARGERLIKSANKASGAESRELRAKSV